MKCRYYEIEFMFSDILGCLPRLLYVYLSNAQQFKNHLTQIEQCSDLQEKYGETMGKKVLRNIVLGAFEEGSRQGESLLGVVTMQETLKNNNYIVESESAQGMMKTAVASLGPKQRREYKDASVSTIAEELLSPDIEPICVLSNLAVSSQARRRGVAATLCQELEETAKEWGYQELYLVVEEANASARKLYETKLGYASVATLENEPALRADIESGDFTEIQTSVVLMKKDLL